MATTNGLDQSSLNCARKLIRHLSRNKGNLSPLLILVHDYPDPDAIASAYALHYLAESRFGIQSRMVFGGIIGRMENRELVRVLKIPIYRLKKQDFRKYANVALVDTQPGFQNNSFPKNRRAAMVVDQHPSDGPINAQLSLVDTSCGATSTILAQALLQVVKEVPTRIATALAYGILSDTLNLYRARRTDVINTYMRILPHCDMRALIRIQNPVRPKQFFWTLAKGISGAMIARKLIVSHLGDVKNPDLVALVADHLLTYKGANWSYCTGRYNGRLHMSLRCANAKAEAGEILRDIVNHRGQAGGHSGIAGGSMRIGLSASDEQWREQEKQLVERIRKRLRIPAKSEFHYLFRQR